MAGNRYLQIVTGVPTQRAALQASAGGGSASELVALNSSGLVDSTMLSGPEVVSMTASETITAGQYVNIFNSSGTGKIRKADNSDTSKQAHGFCPAGISSGSSGVVVLGLGVNSAQSSLTVGAQYWLDTAGGVTATAPSSAGLIVQSLGVAKSTTELDTVIGDVYIY